MRGLIPILSGAALLAIAAVALVSRSDAEPAKVVPPPARDEATAATTSEVAVLAGGCFWGVQGVFQHVDGVTSAVSGYAGGDQATAHYETVGTGATGHANPSASLSIRGKSATAASCKSTSRLRTTPRN